MDPASAIIGFVTTGIQLVKLVKETLDDIKNAPKELQVLRDRAADTEASLRELHRRRLDGLFESDEDVETLNRTGRRVQACLDGISVFTAKVQKTSKDGGLAVDKLKWIMKGSTLQDLSGQLDRLDAALNSVMNLVNSRSQSRQGEILANIQLYAAQSTTTLNDLNILLSAISLRQPAVPYVGHGSPTATYIHAHLTPPSQKLLCASDCACRCHSARSRPIVPWSLVPLIGQVNVARRLSHAIGAFLWECNVQTCRRDRKTRHQLTWVVPWWFPNICASSDSFTFSIHPPRVRPYYALVWEAVYDSDPDALRTLVESGKASVYDVTVGGETVLQYACRFWSYHKTEDAVKVIRFLADAGADPDFAVNQDSVASRIFDASLATLIEHPRSKFLDAVRTSTVAVEICRSIFGMDIVDVLEEYLSGLVNQNAVQMLLRQPDQNELEDTTASAESILRAFGWANILEYSMFYMPQSDIEASEIWDMETIEEVVEFQETLDNNGRGRRASMVNVRLDRQGLLEVNVHFEGEELGDWKARTPGDMSALQLAQNTRLVLRRCPSSLKKLFRILNTRARDVDGGERSEDWESTSYVVPGAFPTRGKASGYV